MMSQNAMQGKKSPTLARSSKSSKKYGPNQAKIKGPDKAKIKGPNQAKNMCQNRPKSRAKLDHHTWAKSGQKHGPKKLK